MLVKETKDYRLLSRLNEQLQALHTALYPDFFKTYEPKEMEDAFSIMVENEKLSFLLLEDGGEAIGYACYEIRDYPESAFKKQYKSLYVHQFVIVDTKRERGFGTFLMKEIYTIAKNRGISLVELDYWAENENAASFYERQGFKKFRAFAYKEL